MAHLKKSASTGHLLKNTAGHLVNDCGEAPPVNLCCCDCFSYTQGQGTIQVACDFGSECEDPACDGATGYCYYNETAVLGYPGTGNKYSGSDCDGAGYPTTRIYDYASNDCVT